MLHRLMALFVRLFPLWVTVASIAARIHLWLAVESMSTYGGFVFGGLSCGWGAVARTISIEVGMQNSGLGAVLATGNFVNPLTAIPSAISAIMHCLLGSALAAYWVRYPTDIID